MEQTERLLRLPDVMTIVGLGKTTIYNRIKKGTFPRPIPLTPRTVGWPKSQIETLVEQIKSGDVRL